MLIADKQKYRISKDENGQKKKIKKLKMSYRPPKNSISFKCHDQMNKYCVVKFE